MMEVVLCDLGASVGK